ncbi:hypothetical protein D3C77_607990 [compost metagenome]
MRGLGTDTPYQRAHLRDQPVQAVTHRRDVTEHLRELVMPLDHNGLRKVTSGDGANAGAGLGKGALEPGQGGEGSQTARQHAHYGQGQIRQQGRAIALRRCLIRMLGRGLLDRLQLA